MIKNSTYIRKFTAKQRQQMEAVALEQQIKTAPEILFFALDKYIEQKQEIARLNRLIQYKQKKIDNLKSK